LRRPSSINRSFALSGDHRDNARSGGAQDDDQPGWHTPHHERQESHYADGEIGWREDRARPNWRIKRSEQQTNDGGIDAGERRPDCGATAQLVRFGAWD